MSNTGFADVPEHVAKSDRPDMAHVKLTKAKPGLREGEVLFVDINSARVLVGRSDAEWFDPDKDEQGAAAAIPRQAGRANVQTMVVKSADAPLTSAHVANPDANVEVVETGTGAGGLVEDGKTAKSSPKP